MKKIILTSMILIGGIMFVSAQNNSNNSVEQKSTKSCCSKGTAEAKSCSSKGTAETKACCSKGTASTGSEKKCSTAETKSCSGHGHGSSENKSGNNAVNDEKKTQKVKSDE